MLALAVLLETLTAIIFSCGAIERQHMTARSRSVHLLLAFSAWLAALAGSLHLCCVKPEPLMSRLGMTTTMFSPLEWVSAARVACGSLWMVAYGMSVKAGFCHYVSRLGLGATMLLCFHRSTAVGAGDVWHQSYLYVGGLAVGLAAVLTQDWMYQHHQFEAPLGLFKFCATWYFGLYLHNHFFGDFPQTVAVLLEVLDIFVVCGCGYLLIKRHDSKHTQGAPTAAGTSYGSTATVGAAVAATPEALPTVIRHVPNLQRHIPVFDNQDSQAAGFGM